MRGCRPRLKPCTPGGQMIDPRSLSSSQKCHSETFSPVSMVAGRTNIRPSSGSGKQTETEGRSFVWCGNGLRRFLDKVSAFSVCQRGDHRSMARNDIVQGLLGSCWFLAGLAAVTERELLQEFCLTAQDDKRGIYEFTFYPEQADGNRQPIKVCVDSRLPIRVEDNKESRSSEIVAYTRARQDGELWPILIEKAYAKLYGSYEAINGGFFCHAVSDFTGGGHGLVTINNTAKKPYKKPDPAEVERLLCEHWAGKKFLGCNWWAPDGGPKVGPCGETCSPNGLVLSHAYSILNVQKVQNFKYAGYTGNVFLQIHNPWGESEWKGPFSDNWAGWTKHPDLQQQFKVVSKNDGAFWMHVHDFATYCRHLYFSDAPPLRAKVDPVPRPNPAPHPKPAQPAPKPVAPTPRPGMSGHRPAAGVYHCARCDWDSCTRCGIKECRSCGSSLPLVANPYGGRTHTAACDVCERVFSTQPPQLRPADVPRRITESFRFFDKDGNGFITATELRQALATMGEQDRRAPEAMIRDADRDGDRRISYDEFVRMIMGLQC